ncbi:MAG: OB-fold nucleic acid binding domain-containing protein, partial [Candidatus Woesearchaeota archaeon]
MDYIKRTHKCDELRLDDKGKEIVLNGWIKTIREHGNVVFIDIKDRYGVTQAVVNKKEYEKNNISVDDVIFLKGVVKERPQKN